MRDRVLAAPGVLREVVERFGVSQAYACRTRARCDKLGQTSAGAQHNHRPLRLAAPAQTLRELCQWVRDVHGIGVGATAMHKTLGRFGLTLKKITQHATAQARPDVAQARADWKDVPGYIGD